MPAGDSFEPVGRTFDEALNAAIRGVRASGDLAQAIVSAKDGAFQLVPLAREDGGHYTGVILDGIQLPKDVTGVSAQRIDSSIQAIVGHDSVFNFTDGPVPTLNLFGPDVWKGERIADIQTAAGSPLDQRSVTLIGRDDAVEVGTSLNRAVENAARMVRESGGATQAIVKGGDNHFYVTHVDGLDGTLPYLRLRDVANAKPVSDSLQLLVGTTTMLNFTSTPVAGAIDARSLSATPVTEPSRR